MLSTVPDPTIKGLTADSREVREGFLFAALQGANDDGAKFVADAEARGAVAVLAAPESLHELQTSLPIVADPNPRRRYALMAARFFRRQPRIVVSVTGTNGKTSVVSFVHQLWSALGYKSASLGTLGLDARSDFGSTDRGTDSVHLSGPALTTPDAAHLHRALAEAADGGIDHLAMEASSHGLDQCRLDGVRLSAAAFTNLSRDHLDYHKDEASYFAAKRRLFDTVLPEDGTAVINADSAEGGFLTELCRQRGQRVLTYGFANQTEQPADICVTAMQSHPVGTKVTIKIGSLRRNIDTHLIGEFQIANLLCAIGLVIATGADSLAALEACGKVQSADGRMQLAGRRTNGAAVYIDYAHTPDALSTVLDSLRPWVSNKLILVFGCGGDRDPGKRQMMGAVAHDKANVIIVTDDNPRSENPSSIRREILKSCHNGMEIADRGEAIKYAIGSANTGDIVLIAGKGHETGQIIGDHVEPFNDLTAIQDLLALEAGSSTG